MDDIKITEGTSLYTPRFCTVKIEKVFDSKEKAYKEGFKEPTFYDHPKYEVLGKSLDQYHMVFAACKKEA